MNYWMRQATLQVGTQLYRFSDFGFGFEVPFEDSQQLMTAKITLYNLSQSTRSSLEKGMPVILNGGYQDDCGVLFVGRVSALCHKKTPTEWQTELSATTALREWLEIDINKTYAQGIDAHSIVCDLLSIFGLEVGELALQQNKTYPRGRVCRGKLKDVLTEIVTSDCKSRFLIRQERVIISDPAAGTDCGFVLCAATGLLQPAGDSDRTEIMQEQDSQKSTTQKKQEAPVIQRECLLCYHLGPGMEVTIQSPSLSGRFLIKKGSHTASPTGDWKTTIEVKAV